jgi:hypothetical protein
LLTEGGVPRVEIESPKAPQRSSFRDAASSSRLGCLARRRGEQPHYLDGQQERSFAVSPTRDKRRRDFRPVFAILESHLATFGDKSAPILRKSE